MRTVYRATSALAVIGTAVVIASTACIANEQYYNVRQYQSGMNLPSVPLPNGFDEVRSSTGATCRSSVASSGSYFDAGVIGGGFNSSGDSMTAYGRVVIPLGPKPKRLNCRHLYNLELDRLRLEVKMLKRGLGSGGNVAGDQNSGQPKVEWDATSRR